MSGAKQIITVQLGGFGAAPFDNRGGSPYGYGGHQGMVHMDPTPLGDNSFPVDGADMVGVERPFRALRGADEWAVVQAQNDLELEILLRGNLLQQQQQRIAILELSLSNTCNEV